MRKHRPSPAMVVAAIALLVALTGTAVAAQVVPLANRAKVADNARKLQNRSLAQVTGIPGPATLLNGKTADAIAATPGPASAAASLVVYKTATRTLEPGVIADTTTACDTGQKAIGGGFQGPDNNFITTFDSRPNPEGTAWRLRLASYTEGNATVTLVAVCLK